MSQERRLGRPIGNVLELGEELDAELIRRLSTRRHIGKLRNENDRLFKLVYNPDGQERKIRVLRPEGKTIEYVLMDDITGLPGIKISGAYFDMVFRMNDRYDANSNQPSNPRPFILRGYTNVYGKRSEVMNYAKEMGWKEVVTALDEKNQLYPI